MLAVIGTAFCWQSCATNPVTGNKEVALVSESQEIAMGREADPQIIAEYGLYPDSGLQRMLRQRGQELARVSHRPNLDWQFRVLDSDVINAFAVPGGYVYFTRGILAHMNNEAQLAGVLGHEIGHVTARHSVSQQTKGLLTQLGVIAAVVVSPELAQFADQLSQGAQLLMLSYSRSDESQSDELGVEYSSKLGYDAKEMAKFFLTLQASNRQSGNGELPEFLSTHPDPGNRYQRVTKLATQYQQKNNLTNLKINRNGYLQQVAGLIYGEDPKQGFMQNGIFYHPELRFQFNAPQGWQYKNSPSNVMFAPQQGNGLVLMALGNGNSPQAAAQGFVQNAKLQVQDSKQTTVNGLPAYIVLGDQVQQAQNGQQQTVRVVAAFIQYNGKQYMIAGACPPSSFNQHFQMYQNIYNSFRPLTDQSIINIKPERVMLHTVKSSSTLQQQLSSLGIPSSRMTEMSILNGMNLNDAVSSGTVIKYVKRG